MASEAMLSKRTLDNTLLQILAPIWALDKGEDHHKIQRWVADGWLRDRLQGTRRHDGNGRDIHRFREKDILGFIRQHPLEINLGRVDAVWFLDMILLKGREFL